MNEPGFAVTVGGLIEVHEVHIDRAPRQVSIELSVQVKERLLQDIQTPDPHFGRRERVHPYHQATAVRIRVGGDAEVGDFFRRRE